MAFRRRAPAYPGEQPAAPPPGPPPGWLAWENPWPWLALLGIVVVAGLLIWLLVFRGSNRASVPSVVGMQATAATARLNRAGFDVKVVLGPSPRPRGVVASQVPGGGTQLKKNQQVVIHVSNGKRAGVTTTTAPTTTAPPTTTAAPTTVAMPDVVGKQQADGGGAVEAAGLVADTFPVRSKQAAGTILAETPSAGSQVKAGRSVRLTVSAGNTSQAAKTIPSVTGRKAAAARTKLWTAGFTTRTTYRTGSAGTVVAQRPTGTAAPYTQITITVGR